MEKLYVKAGEATLEVLAWGSGEALVMVPSSGRGATDFTALAERLARDGFRPLAVSLRGIEGSTGPLKGLTLHTLAADVGRVVEDLVGGPAHILGHALGNTVVRCLAADRADLVRSVVLVAAGGLVPPEAGVGPPFQRCFQLDLPAAQRVQAVREAFFASGNDASVWLGGWWPEAHHAHGVALRATPREDWWEAGTAPLLAIQGLEDRLAPPANGHALRLAAGDRVQVVDLPKAGHALLPEQPEAIAALVVAFLKRQSPKGGSPPRGKPTGGR